MDITAITDIKELKSMAYDQIAIKAQADQNLAALQQRMSQLEQNKEEKESNGNTK